MGWCDECDNSLGDCTCKKKEDDCDHRFVWQTGNKFKCHECGDIKVM